MDIGIRAVHELLEGGTDEEKPCAARDDRRCQPDENLQRR
jgi:hypothetical protein